MVMFFEHYLINFFIFFEICLCAKSVFFVEYRLKKRLFIVAIVLFIGTVIETYVVNGKTLFLFFFLKLLCFHIISKRKIKDNIKLFLMAFFVVEAVNAVIYFVIAQIFGLKIEEINNFQNPKLDIFCTIPCILFWLLVFGLRSKNRRKYEIIKLRNYWVLLICAIFAGFSIVFALYFINDGEDLVIQAVNWLSLFLMLGSALSLYIAIFCIKKLQEMEELKNREIAAVKKTEQLTKDYCVELYSKNEELRSYQHDIRHLLKFLKESIENGDIQNALGMIGETDQRMEKTTEKIVYSQNKIIDSTIYGILGKAICEDKITFDYKGYMPSSDNISDVDLCLVLANVFENALEATLDSKQNPLIKMKSIYKGNVFCFEISNPTTKQDLNLVTDKDDEMHGYGIKNIRRILEKYNGVYECRIENNRFYVRIVFGERNKE